VKILITTAQVPFTRGGAEILADNLLAACRAAGHEAEIIAIPFKRYPAERILDQMLACRLLDVTEANDTPVDLVIGLKFPSYLVHHPHKVLWLLHQHRPAYDLWDSPFGDLIQTPNGVQVRDAIRRADQQFIPQARAVFTIARNVSRRLQHYCGIDSTALYHPPLNAEHLYGADAEDYLFFPSRLTAIKRQALVVEALAYTRRPVCVRFAGAPDHAPYEEELHELARTCKVQRRVQWLGPVSEEEKRRQYAHALGVVYPPADEDYGYVTLEAMLASKPVLTTTDSGGPLEFVQHGKTGLVAEPTPRALAAIMDELWHHKAQARQLGQAGRAYYDELEISWPKVVQRLVSCA
jgi:glycosyltransferase involved in cell wall biosynthesis